MHIGLIGIVSEAARTDFWGTMAQMAEMGYQGIEALDLDGLPGERSANLARLHEMGLAHLTVSATQEELRDRLDEVRNRALAGAAARVTVWWSEANDRELLLREAEVYDASGASLIQDGIRLCYHNHDHEYRNRFDGQRAMDLLAENTDPGHLSFTIDAGWVAIAGADPADELRKLKGRVAAIHAKDFFDLSDRDSFTAVGTGKVDFTRVVEAAKEIGTDWIVVEQDRLRNLPALDAARVSILNLRECGA